MKSNSLNTYTMRLSALSDVSAIMEIIEYAQLDFAQQGVDQWQNGYPNKESITLDIDNKNSYVCMNGDEVVATAMISTDGEPTYSTIDGQWLVQSNSYVVVHRIAVKCTFKGKQIAGLILNFAEKLGMKRGVSSIRIDTHKNNKAMQRVIEKMKFNYCGTIQVHDGSLRLAYEKTLEI